MTKDETKRRGPSRAMTTRPTVRELAEAGAAGRILTPAETMAVCEALRARGARNPNQFHSGV